MNLSEAIKTGSEQLGIAGVPEPVREATLLLRLAIECDAAFIIAHADRELSAIEERKFSEFLVRRAAREPYQQIAGIQEFFGLEFIVTPDVLIPRPETEILVEAVISKHGSSSDVRFLEFGVGSGCISVSILANLPNSKAVAVDISEKAIEIAKRNAERHRVDERLELRQSDLLENVPETNFDLIVSNPPYVPEDSIRSLQAEVRDHEPLIALSGGNDGLSIIRRIITDSERALRPLGDLFMEIGWDQAEKVSELMETANWDRFNLVPDLQGIPRILLAKKGN